MYIVEYIKADGRVITLAIEDDIELQDTVDSLMGRIIDGYVISFNVEVLS